MRRAKLSLCLAAGLLLVALSPTAAQADSPWWHLTSTTRPSKVSPGVASNAVQQLTVKASGGNFTLRREEPLAAGKKETAALPFNVSHEALQSALEELYGAGNVAVSGGPGDAEGTHPYRIEFEGGLADQPVAKLAVAPAIAEVTALDSGHSDAELVITATNLGSAPAEGSGSPIRLEATLPPKLEAVGILAVAPGPHGTESATFPCSLATLSCEFKGTVAPFDRIEMRIDAVAEAGLSAAEEDQVSISGGGAPAVSISRPLQVAGEGEEVPFGLADNELSLEEVGGGDAKAAASHPSQVTSTLVLNQGEETAPLGNKPKVEPAGATKDLNVKLPPGFLGNPKPLTRCSLAAFVTFVESGAIGSDTCPAQAAVGVATLDINEPGVLHGFHTFTVPVFNLEPAFGEPARFGFYIPIARLPVLLSTSLRDGEGEAGEGDYGITVSALNTTQTIGFIDSSVTLWGTPAAAGHDASRGWGCLAASREEESTLPCEASTTPHPPAFQTLPARCGEALVASLSLNSWADPATFLDVPTTEPLPAMGSCNQVPFKPEVDSQPTSDATTSGTGLAFDLNFEDEGLLNAEGIAQSPLKRAVVTLPQGFTANPSLAEGLKACSLAEYEAATVQAGTGCNEESKVGSAEIESPLVKQTVNGSIYVAKQGENPYHNLLTLYLVARNPEIGVLVRQALKVTPDPVTGQLTTEVDNVPQLAFSHFRLQFRSGQRSPLITPPACGTYTVKALLYPWSAPATPVEKTSSFQITQGPEGLPCPSGGLPPFHPELIAGTVNNAAGTFSPFDTRITRKDSEQEITNFSIKLPPGVIGKLAGLGECSDAQVAAAKAREHEGGGAEEEASPSCPASSEVGRSLVGAGVGNVLAYAPGKIYLAGPYHGSNLSMVAITAAKVGPFDLGTVVVRFALRVNPETAEVFVDATGSDPIPHIVDGIPVHLRDIRAYVDKPDFVLNPTSCEKTSTASTVLGAGLDFASEEDNNPITVTSPFQAADCAALPFHPQLGLKLIGKTNRGAHPAFHAHLAMNGIGEAGIAVAQVTLPKSEYIENAHFDTICTRVQFKEGAGNGAACPAGSIYGHAKAVTPLLSEPLEGPVFLRSSEHQLPDLVVALHNSQVDFDLVGHVEGVKGGGLRNTFEASPDAPVTSFDLEMEGGKKGLFVNSTDLCAHKHFASADFTGHNGKAYDSKPVMKAKCPKARKHKQAKKRHHRARRAKR
jgi:hypothetical protein